MQTPLGKAIPEYAQHLETVLLHGATAVIIPGRELYTDWGDNALGRAAAVRRRLFEEFLEEAHALRIRVYLMGDEFLYLPEWFKQFDGKLSTDDAGLWEALKDKQRRLLDDLPTLDGIGTRTGEILPRGEIRAWDPIHTREDRALEAELPALREGHARGRRGRAQPALHAPHVGPSTAGSSTACRRSMPASSRTRSRKRTCS